MDLTERGSVLEIHAFVTAGMTRIEIQSWQLSEIVVYLWKARLGWLEVDHLCYSGHFMSDEQKKWSTPSWNSLYRHVNSTFHILGYCCD
jgi:hypothetical protein